MIVLHRSRTALLLLLTKVFEPRIEVTCTTTNGHGLVAFYTECLIDIILSHLEIEMNEWYHQGATQNGYDEDI